MLGKNLYTFLIVTVLALIGGGIIGYYYRGQHQTEPVRIEAQSNQIVITTTPRPGEGNLQLHTFIVITTTPHPTAVPVATATSGPTPTTGTVPTQLPLPTSSGTRPITTPAIGGPQPPTNYYCIDDEDPDMCDDNSSHLVPKGNGGTQGSCGAIIAATHQLVSALPQVMKGTRDSLTKAVSTACGSTGPASSYVSTHLVIDAYNLAGFSELSKSNPSHVSPTGLFTWWQSPPPGYVFIPYTTTAIHEFGSGQRDLTGCVIFLKTSSSYHIGIVNALELFNANGDGVLSVLQSGTSMYIDRFPVAGWSVSNASTNQTNTNGVQGFGCHI